MALITPNSLGPDDDTARLILVAARGVAPCLDTLNTDTEPGKDALAVLKIVYREVVDRGSTRVRRQSIGPASVEYSDIVEVLSGAHEAALRSICAGAGAPVPVLGLPRGSFPIHSPVTRAWPEGEYT